MKRLKLQCCWRPGTLVVNVSTMTLGSENFDGHMRWLWSSRSIFETNQPPSCLNISANWTLSVPKYSWGTGRSGVWGLYMDGWNFSQNLKRKEPQRSLGIGTILTILWLSDLFWGWWVNGWPEISKVVLLVTSNYWGSRDYFGGYNVKYTWNRKQSILDTWKCRWFPPIFLWYKYWFIIQLMAPTFLMKVAVSDSRFQSGHVPFGSFFPKRWRVL